MNMYDPSEKKKKNKGPMLYFKGTLLLLAGLYITFNLQSAQDMLSLDEGITRTIGFGLLILGIIDIFLGKLLFSKKKIRK
jgi:hypothetical protein